MRRELVLEAHLAIESLRTSTDAEELQSAHNALAFLIYYTSLACRRSERMDAAAAIAAAAQALVHIDERRERTGIMRGTGPELQTLTLAVNTADAVIPLLGTARLEDALIEVDRTFAALTHTRQHACVA
jgi:hypothetical protein